MFGIQFSDIVSLFAIGISIYTFLLGKLNSKRLNDINLESQLYMDVFKDFLLMKLPRGRNKLTFNKGTLVDYEDLEDSLLEMKRSSLYFLYRNKKFYEDLKIKCNYLEDLLITSAGNKSVGTEVNDILNKVDTGLSDIYSCIFDNFIGQDK